MDAPAKTCFIAMPVSTSNDHAEKFGDKNHWKHVLETLFVPAVEAAGFRPLLPTAQGSHMIHAQIVQHLSQADMVLVDISHNNPNVFFELGVRTSVNKPIALVRCDASVAIPFDVNGINTHAYDPALKAWHISEEIENLAEHVRQAENSCAGTNPMWRQFGMQLKATEPTVGETKEEAQLALLTRQVGELLDQRGSTAEVPAWATNPRRGSFIISANTPDKTASPERQAERIETARMRVIAVGHERGLRVHVNEGDAESGVVRVRLVEQPSSMADYDAFLATVQRISMKTGVNIEMVLG